jgi:hypothetical protein
MDAALRRGLGDVGLAGVVAADEDGIQLLCICS